ncbi:hypothetical protein C8J57DRAFT_1508601 [Mycena rebaudengoi]|nr:hypothetical protein C8J57DRAFT_1508601 [Mycena rebaudengoi]
MAQQLVSPSSFFSVISYLSVEVFEHHHATVFSIPTATSFLRTKQFAHIPSINLLSVLSKTPTLLPTGLSLFSEDAERFKILQKGVTNFHDAMEREAISAEEKEAEQSVRTLVFRRASPDDGFLTLYDYTQGPVKINLQSLNSAKTNEVLGSTEWTNIVSRAERSGGRMGLDVLVFSGCEEYHYYAISLRSNKSTVNDGLRALGDELPPDIENWDESFFEDRFQRFLDSNDEDKELVEIH